MACADCNPIAKIAELEAEIEQLKKENIIMRGCRGCCHGCGHCNHCTRIHIPIPIYTPITTTPWYTTYYNNTSGAIGGTTYQITTS